MDPLTCPNTLYVATTRASSRLFLLESDEWASDRPLKFLRMSHNEMRTQSFIDFRGIPRSRFEEESERINRDPDELPCHKVTPTDLTKFVSESVLEEITPLLDALFVKESGDDSSIIALPSTVKTTAGFFEDVSDLNGIAIPAILYDYITALYDTGDEPPTGILYQMIRENLAQTKPNKHLFLKNQPLVPICENIGDYLFMANVFEAAQEKLYFKLKQISRDEYTWLTPALLSECKRRMLSVLKKEIHKGPPKMEFPIITYDDDAANAKLNRCLSPHMKDIFAFSARIDLLTRKTLWELKCTSEITAEHMIQTAIYAWIMRIAYPSLSQQVKIFNIKTGHVLRLDATNEQLTTIVVALLKGKYEKSPPSSEEDFLGECHKTISSHPIQEEPSSTFVT